MLTLTLLIPCSRIWQDHSAVSTLYFGRLKKPLSTCTNIPTCSASAVSYVFAHKSRTGEIITFFFPQFNDPQSLCAETVIRSIIRQSLDPMTLSEEMEASLVEMDLKPSTGVGELTVLLRQRLAQSEKFFIFIDALDEFEPRERRELLNLLASLGSSGSGLRVFLAGRESLREELNDKLSGIERLSMASAEAMTDVALYVQEALEERIKNGDLVVGDQSLILYVKQALTEHADGMYVDNTSAPYLY
jgi:hypothetical protein